MSEETSKSSSTPTDPKSDLESLKKEKREPILKEKVSLFEQKSETSSKSTENLKDSQQSESITLKEATSEEKTLEEISSEEMEISELESMPTAPNWKKAVKTGWYLVKEISFPHVILRAVGCYFMAIACFLFLNREAIKNDEIDAIDKWQEFVDKLPIAPILLCVLSGFLVLSVLRFSIKKIWKIQCEPDGLVLTVGIVAMAFQTVWRTNNFYYTIAFILVCGIAAWFAYRYGAFRVIEKWPKAVIYLIIAVLMGLSGVFIAVFTIYRHKIYGSMAFDFGIFVQMYHYMAECLKPLTTCERSKLLSHFAVHFSPIYYVLLPFYYFFPSAYTLLIGQAVLVATGVIPLVGICRKQKLSNLSTLGFSIVYLFCVELIMPCFYDFHENAFLPMLFMWFFYAVEKRNYVLMYIMTALLLVVKEDVPVYMMLLGIYCIFRMEKRYHGIIITGVSGIYFIIVTKWMKKYGEGVMTSRTYGNLMTDQDGSFGNIIKTVITDPMYFITQCVDEKDFKLLLTIMIPLAFLPFITKHFSHYFLIAPFLLMNLASGYGYANDYGYQYVFGTTACLIYCAVINYAELKSKQKEFLPIFMSISTLLFFSSVIAGSVGSKENYENSIDKYNIKDELLASIPEDASVACDSFYLPHVAERDEVYLMDNANGEEYTFTDFVIIRTELHSDWEDEKRNQLDARGYVYFDGSQDIMDIYVSPEYLAEHPELELATKDY